MSHTQLPQPRADLIEEAAEWLAALDAGSVTPAAFEAWRDADVRHAVAFAEVAGVWRDLDRVRDDRDAMQAPAAPPSRDQINRPDRRHLLRTAASIAVVSVLGGGFAYRSYARDTVRTKVGERRTIDAAPGLTIDLNTDSCIHWRDGTPIGLWLEQGEAAIRVGDGYAARLRTPAGTFDLAPGRFNARLRGDSCELAVIAGSLNDARHERLSAGQVAVAGAGHLGTMMAGDADIARVTAWQRDTLMLSGESLDYAIAEMNRYLPAKIVIGDPALSRLRLGGTFATTDPTEFLLALHGAFGIHARVAAGGGIVLTRG